MQWVKLGIHLVCQVRWVAQQEAAAVMERGGGGEMGHQLQGSPRAAPAEGVVPPYTKVRQAHIILRSGI